MNNYENRLGWLYNREFAFAPTVDWAWLRMVGMVMELERYWTKVFVGDGFSLTCNGWRNLFSIQDLVYRKLSVEFFAIMSFKDNTVDRTYNWALAFRLGGVYRKCSLWEFA